MHKCCLKILLFKSFINKIIFIYYIMYYLLINDFITVLKYSLKIINYSNYSTKIYSLLK